ncbi:MAG: four helix bundle protein [bacterium]
MQETSESFALLVIECYSYVIKYHKEFVVARQLLKSGTSIGANIKNAQDGQSKKDFLSKMNIALKEAKETVYRVTLLSKS